MYTNSFTLALTLASVYGASAAPAAESPYKCNPAHSYPNGQSCDATGLTLIYPSTTAAPAATTSAYKCNPAHSYPNGQSCDATALTLVYPSTTAAPAATSSAYKCNPAHSYPNGQSCDATALTLIYPSTTAAGAAATTITLADVTTTVAVPAATSAVSSGVPSVSDSDKEWIVRNLNRYCGETTNSCDYNFDIEGNGRTEHCTIVNSAGPNDDFYAQSCGANSAWEANWGLAKDANPQFAVLTVDNVQSKTRAFFGVANVNGQSGSTYGSGNFGDIGPQPVTTY